MIGEWSFFGIYMPWLLPLTLATLALMWGLRRVLAAIGAYRWVWHPALFDMALFVLGLYGLSLVSPMFGSWLS